MTTENLAQPGQPAGGLRCGTGMPLPGLTLRSLLSGLVLALAVGALGPFLYLYIDGADSSNFFLPPLATFLLFILVGFVNVALGAVRRSWAFHKGELVVVFILMSLANSTHIMVHYWVPMVGSPFYYARSENNWLTVINPHIPTWIVPHDSEAIRAFFEGAQGGAADISWEVWLEPMLGWLPMFMALHVATLCLMVILRRRWMEHERLIYPIMQMPLAMVQDDPRVRWSSRFFAAAPCGWGLPSPCLWVARWDCTDITPSFLESI